MGAARAAFAAQATIPPGASFNGAFMAWLRETTGSSATTLNGLLAAWAATDYTFPGEPVEDFAEVSHSETTASFSWTPPIGATSITIGQSEDGLDWTNAQGDIGMGAGSVEGLTPNQTYHFRLNVTGGDNDGTSNVVSLTTNSEPVTDFAEVSHGETTASFSWTATIGQSAIKIQQNEEGGGWVDSNDDIDAGAGTGSVSGLDPNSAYDFRLVVDGGQNDGTSNTVALSTDADPVEDFAVDEFDSRTASFTWTSVDEETEVVIEQSEDGAGGPFSESDHDITTP